MKNKLSDISGFIKVEKLKRNRQIVVFSICLAIATILWFLNALSKDYSTSVNYPVKFVNPPRNQFVANSLPSRFEFKVEAHGFTLLRHKLSFSFSPILLNLTTLTKGVTPDAGNYTIKTSSLIATISEQVSNEITITEINPGELVIKLDSLKTKTVPVEPDVSLHFNPQYNLKEPVSSHPQQVLITGPASVLDTISSLKTEHKTFEKLEKTIEKVVSVIHPDKTDLKPEKVTLKIPAEKFTEKELKIPVQIKNKPEGMKIKLFPSEVKISFLVGLGEFENITPERFSAVVDFDKRTPESENLEIILEKQPSYIQILRIFPQSVEYLTETE